MIDRQIYGGIGLGVAAAAVISMFALSNVSVGFAKFLQWNGRLGSATQPIPCLTAIVHLDSSREILVAVYNHDLCGPSHHHDY